MGTRVLRFIPNTPALMAWGKKLRTSHLSDWINSQKEGNILNSKKRCIAHMKQVFIIQDHTSKFTQILHPLNIRLLQDGHPSGHPHNKFRGCDAPCPVVVLPLSASQRLAWPTTPSHGRKPGLHLPCRRTA